MYIYKVCNLIQAHHKPRLCAIMGYCFNIIG